MNEIARKLIQIQEQVVNFDTVASKVLKSNQQIVEKIFIAPGLHVPKKTLQNQFNNSPLFKFNYVH